MPVTYQRCPREVVERGKQVMAQHHDGLVEVEAKIAYLFADPEKDEHGRPLAPAVTVGGYPCAAKAKIIGLKERADGRADAEVVIDRDEWEGLSDPERDALLDHELHHFELRRDKETGAPLSDDLGRPRLTLRKHDHQFGWFDVIAKRHGAASYEVKQARTFADQHGQTYFGWGKPDGVEEGLTPAAPPAVEAALKRLVKPVADGSVESITMESGNGKSATIDRKAAKRLLAKSK